MKKQLKQAKTKALFHKLTIGAIACAALLLYILGVTVDPGWVTYIIQLPALLIISLTALARVNDIGPERTGWEWHTRRVALSLAGAAAISLVVSPFSGGEFPTWRGLALTWGVAGAWLTTPGMPPWAKYIAGKVKLPENMT
jgi:hypothetical protein